MTIAKSVQGDAKGTDTVSSFVTRLNEHLDDIRLDVGHNANRVKKGRRGKEIVVLLEGT